MPDYPPIAVPTVPVPDDNRYAEFRRRADSLRRFHLPTTPEEVAVAESEMDEASVVLPESLRDPASILRRADCVESMHGVADPIAFMAKVREAVRQYGRCQTHTPFDLCAAMDDLVALLPAE